MVLEGLKPEARELLALVKTRMKEANAPYRQALSEVCCEHPKLAEQYREEGLNRKIRYETIGPPDRPFRVAVATCQERLIELVRQRVKEKGISFKAALCEVAIENRELSDAARSEAVNSQFR